MESNDVLRLLDHLQDKQDFSEPAELLRQAIRNGARISESPGPISVAEMLPKHAGDDEHLREIDQQIPGYRKSVDAISESAEGRVVLVGVLLPQSGGALLLSEDRTPLACFAYDDRVGNESDSIRS